MAIYRAAAAAPREFVEPAPAGIVAAAHVPRVLYERTTEEPQSFWPWLLGGAALVGGVIATRNPALFASVGLPAYAPSIVLGGAAVVAAAAKPAKRWPEPVGPIEATAHVPREFRAVVDDALVGAERGLQKAAHDAGISARAIPVSDLALLARVAIDFGPLTWGDPSPHLEELLALAEGPDTQAARVRVMKIAMGGVEHGVGIPHDAGRTEMNIQTSDIELAVWTALGVVNWWTSSATYWRPTKPRLWSGDVLRWASRFINTPRCDLELDGYTMNERYALLGTAGCEVRSEAYNRWIAAAIIEWGIRRGVKVPRVPHVQWAVAIPTVGTEADQRDLVATLAPVLSNIATAKITIWFSRVPSAWDTWGAGDIVLAVIGGIVAAAALAGAAAGIGAAIGGAVAGGAAGVAAAAGTGGAGAAAVSTATGIAAGGAGVAGTAAGAAGAGVAAAGAALGLSPAVTAGLVSVAGAAATAAVNAAIDAAKGDDDD